MRTRRHRHDKLIKGHVIQLTRGNLWLGTLAHGGGDYGLYLRLVGMGRMEIFAFMNTNDGASLDSDGWYIQELQAIGIYNIDFDARFPCPSSYYT
ncbi:hypothetical protein EYC84_001070 [Monilinia fructicola]|uniref:Uncharacterized protein n=1 Tax=Monilinia fructicola TaxID=38448 RepID=A0A5M9JJ05_MONFR|nr:hypothetical protein EYC84_001070 [Monilinia fructicola]